MSTPAEKPYELNIKQLTILRLLYRFRFATSYHLSIASDSTQARINKRLQVLLRHQYIGRNYNSYDKIHGRKAEYYLLEKGINALKQRMPERCDVRMLKNIYKDKDAKNSFIAHQLDVFTVYCNLLERYGDRLQFFTKSQLYPYRHFPKQKPDAFIRLAVDGAQKEFMLEVMDPGSRFFAYVAKVKRYCDFADDGTWEATAATNFPKILFVADSVGTGIQFQKQAGRLLLRHYSDEPQIFVANLGSLTHKTPRYERIWRNAEEPEVPAALHDL